ncbi:hypothetical protein [Trebonia sp.]|uniref:hypothetical protein n=1 Tax=Trebonia sp. TaxID=2767075 RepID=UPI002604320B|nr:hypothetical protein [Trebonia sp.]
MDTDQIVTLRALLVSTGWLERVRVFGRALRTSTRSPGGLLVVGTPAFEPWHLTAHLDEESRLAGIPELMPTLVRWSPPADAPPHLRVGLSRLEAARRGETLFVVSDETAPVPLLERVNDARHVGATILALDTGDRELDALAHESLSVPQHGPGARGVNGGTGSPPLAGGRRGVGPRGQAALTFDAVQHLVSAAAGERDTAGAGAAGAAGGKRGSRGLRERLARLLDTVSGPTT